MTSSGIVDAALSLPDSERAEIALRMLESLPPVEPGATDDELVMEAETRDREMDQDPAASLSHKELMDSLRSRFR